MTLPPESDTTEQPAAVPPHAGWTTRLLIAVAVGLLVPLGLFFRTPPLPELADGIPIPAESSAVSWEKITIQSVVQVSVDQLPIASIVSGLSSRTYQRDVRISNVQIVDIDGDGKMEVLACDAAANQVVVYRNRGKNQWHSEVIGRNLRAPAHATVVDIDQDGDLDLFLAGLKANQDVVARVYEPGQAIGADAAKARLAKLEKVEAGSDSKLTGIEDAIREVALAGKDKSSEELIKRSIAKDGKYEAPKSLDVSGVDLTDPALIAKGKILFMTKTCFTCHQVDPAIPAPAGLALKAPQFIGDFWGKEREVHIGYLGPIKKVVMNEEYFIESVTDPMAKVLKGALAPMILAPGLVNNEEILALMAYVKSHSK